MTGPAHEVHTDGNAVPPVDDTELGDLLDHLTGIHPGLDLMVDGARHLATARLTVDETQTLDAGLAGSSGLDVLTLVGLLVARISDANTNPCLRSVSFDQQKDALHHAEHLVHHLAADYDLHQHASEASAAITRTN